MNSTLKYPLSEFDLSFLFKTLKKQGLADGTD